MVLKHDLFYDFLCLFYDLFYDLKKLNFLVYDFYDGFYDFIYDQIYYFLNLNSVFLVPVNFPGFKSHLNEEIYAT